MDRGDLIQIAAPDRSSNAAKHEIDSSIRNGLAALPRRPRSVVAEVNGEKLYPQRFLRVAERKADADRDRPLFFLHQFPGDIVNGSNMACIDSVTQTEAVGRQRSPGQYGW